MIEPRAVRPFIALTRASAARPRTTIILAAVLVCLSLVALQRLRISASLDAMFGLESPAARALHRVSHHYRAGDALLVLVQRRDASESPAPAELVAFAERFTSLLLADERTGPRIAWARFHDDPAYAKFVRHEIVPNAPFYVGPDQTRAFLSRLSPAQLREQFDRNEALIASPGPGSQAISEAILRDPLRLADFLPRSPGATLSLESALPAPQSPEMSLDGRALLIRIGATASPGDFSEAAALNAMVNEIAAAANTGGLDIRIGGPHAIAAAASGTIRADAIAGTLISVGLLYALFVIFHRRWVPPILIGITAGAGMAAGFALPALAAPTVSPLAAAVAALLAGLGVDYGIHFVAHYDHLRSGGLSPAESAVESSRHMALPISTSCITCIFGFASLWPSQVQMLSDFARFGAAGLLGALLAAFTLLPALLILTDRRSATVRSAPPRFGFAADLIARRPRRWAFTSLGLLLTALAAAGCHGFVPRLESDLTVLHPRPNPALEATGEVMARFAGQGEFIPILLRSSSPDSLISEAIDAARSLSTDECRRAGVVDVLGLHLLLPDPRRSAAVRDALSGVNPAQALADFDDALNQSIFEPAAYSGYRDLIARLITADAPPTTRDLLGYPTIASRLFPIDPGPGLPSETLLLVRMAAPLKDRITRAAVVKTLTDALNDHPGAALAALPAVAEEIERTTRAGMPRSVLISAALVLIWLWVVFQRGSDVFLAIIPLLFASTFALAFMTATRHPFNPINSVAIPLLDGIAVDAGVFLVSVMRRHKGDPAGLARDLRPTVHAVLLATATTITGFASLWAMHTPAIRSLGLIASVGLAASAIGSLGLLLPLLLIRARAGSRESGNPPAGAP